MLGRADRLPGASRDAAVLGDDLACMLTIRSMASEIRQVTVTVRPAWTGGTPVVRADQDPPQLRVGEVGELCNG